MHIGGGLNAEEEDARCEAPPGDYSSPPSTLRSLSPRRVRQRGRKERERERGGGERERVMRRERGRLRKIVHVAAGGNYAARKWEGGREKE